MGAIKKPEDLEITKEIVDWAVAAGIRVCLEAELAAFVDHCDANGKKYKNYTAAFRNWCRRSDKWRQERGGAPVDPRPVGFISDPDSTPEAGTPEERLKADIGQARYEAWIAKCDFKVGRGGVVINAPNRSVSDYIRREMIGPIAKAYQVETTAVTVHLAAGKR